MTNDELGALRMSLGNARKTVAGTETATALFVCKKT
jgi:hypothetical protein